MSEISEIAEFPYSMFWRGCGELEPQLAVLRGVCSVESMLVDFQ
jgi:hypothetical protein